MEDGRREVGRVNGPVGRGSPKAVAAANHLSAPDACARERHRENLSPMIPPARRVDFWGAPELAHHHHQRLLEQAALVEILQQGCVGEVELRREHVLDALGVL